MNNFETLELIMIVATAILACVAGLMAYRYWKHNRYGGAFSKHYGEDTK